MGLLLGLLPIAVAGFDYYAANRVNQTVPSGGSDIVNLLNQMIKTNQLTFGWGLPAYLGSAALLFLTALFAPGRRRA